MKYQLTILLFNPEHKWSNNKMSLLELGERYWTVYRITARQYYSTSIYLEIIINKITDKIIFTCSPDHQTSIFTCSRAN